MHSLMHTMYRSLLGQINWLRRAAMAASPIGDVKSLKKLARQIKSEPVKLQYWPLNGPLRIHGFPGCGRVTNTHGDVF